MFVDLILSPFFADRSILNTYLSLEVDEEGLTASL